MKLELARAMLYNADLLLLDEPTNHLDVHNVAWLEQWVTGQKNMTTLVVSHDSGFLDNVCTDIIHYERKKLAYYRGNLSECVIRAVILRCGSGICLTVTPFQVCQKATGGQNLLYTQRFSYQI